MSYSISASKAKATHDAAMSRIESEAKERARKTEHLRQLRLASEAETGAVDRVAVPSSKSRSSTTGLGVRGSRRTAVEKAPRLNS
jgi:hypothetical protein